jgi:hypothetical protein
MNLSRVLGLSFALVLVLIADSAIGQQQAPPAPPLLNANALRMQPEAPGAANNNRLFGNPTEPGYYIQRNRYAPNATTRPHFHDQDRWVTVIKGTWYTGEGKVYRPETMVPIKQGGIMYHPAGFVHYDGSRDGEEVILYISGIGPVKTTQVEEDEAGNPVKR